MYYKVNQFVICIYMYMYIYMYICNVNVIVIFQMIEMCEILQSNVHALVDQLQLLQNQVLFGCY